MLSLASRLAWSMTPITIKTHPQAVPPPTAAKPARICYDMIGLRFRAQAKKKALAKSEKYKKVPRALSCTTIPVVQYIMGDDPPSNCLPGTRCCIVVMCCGTFAYRNPIFAKYGLRTTSCMIVPTASSTPPKPRTKNCVAAVLLWETWGDSTCNSV